MKSEICDSEQSFHSLLSQENRHVAFHDTKSGNCLEYSRKNATFAAQEQIKNR
jgi:DNA-dependent RNA polymerase auxiliary subunit epsilon